MDYRRIGNQVAVGVAVAVLASASHARTHHVDIDNCPGPGSGTPGDPYCSIQTAIDNAVDTDEIVVAPGTYCETIYFLGKAVTLRSSDGADVTIIDGQQLGTVVTCDSGEGPDTVLEGFTITGGTGTIFGSTSLGGGMLNDGSSPTVIGCTFSENSAIEGAGMWNYESSLTVTNCAFFTNQADGSGGGMYNENSNPAVTGCTFNGNAAQDGGAMFNLGSSLVLTSCGFEENSADDDGGAIFNDQCTTVFEDCTFTANSVATGSGHLGGAICNILSVNTMTQCTFIGNIAIGGSNTGGGAILSADTTETLTDCHFQDNQGQLGGALTHPEFAPPVEPLLVVNCTFVNNISGAAGALHLQSTVATIINCDIIGNRAEHPTIGSGGGAAVLHGGDVAADITMINTRITGNFALKKGGGIFNGGASSISMANCTVAANEAANVAGGIWNSDEIGTGNVENCILWGNSDGQGSGEPAQILLNGGHFAVEYSCIQGLTGALGGDGNIDANPLFVDPANGDYRLRPGSPCIDAGDNSAVPEGILKDLDGSPRFVDDPGLCDLGESDGVNPVVDIGAYEFQRVSPLVDCNGNDAPDTCDIVDTVSLDCNGNVVPDECDLDHGTSLDCNENGLPDECDIDEGTSLDCNANEVPDNCDIADGTSTDLNGNGVPDECEADCNENGIPDDMEIDCNGNDIPDDCDIEDGPSSDCNVNGVPDECDITEGTSWDVNGNGIPDDCECLGDGNGDGSVTATDFLWLLSEWGPCPGCPTDINNDDVVDVQDFLALLANWGPCP